MSVFPKNFYWGAATASYQVEGGIENCDWADAARQGKVPECGIACDHYNRYEQDFDLVKELGHNAHRFSIEWARIEPEEGKFDEKEIEHYRQVIKALKVRGIRPFVTLWHFTLPAWFAESGGFERRDAPEIFARYCKKVVMSLDEHCQHFATINEPNVYAGHGWIYGAWPPFKRAKILWKKIGKEDGTSESINKTVSFKNFLLYRRVERNLIKSHKLAFSEIKKVSPRSLISLVKHVRVFDSDRKPWNIFLAKVMQYLQTKRFMNQVANHLDEIGLNYYRYTKFGDKRIWKKTDMDWNFAPEKIYMALKMLTRYKKPLFVSEAGLADHDDSDRAEYISKQVAGVAKALQEGIDVRGHMYWSLLDNYEWALGFEKRFGLIEIDYSTLERKIRPSAYVYKKIIENNGIV